MKDVHDLLSDVYSATIAEIPVLGREVRVRVGAAWRDADDSWLVAIGG